MHGFMEQLIVPISIHEAIALLQQAIALLQQAILWRCASQQCGLARSVC